MKWQNYLKRKKNRYIVRKFTSVKTNISSLHTEINNVKRRHQDKCWKSKVKDTYGINK